MYRKTWLEIDTDKIRHNIEILRRHSGKELMAVLKANAYGAGDIGVLHAVRAAGIQKIAVSSLEEALHMRRYGDEDILILGPVAPEHAGICIENRITIPAYDMAMIKALPDDCTGLKVHIKADTGMNRIGLDTLKDIQEAIRILQEKHADVEGIFTHFATADSDLEYTEIQFDKFSHFVRHAGHDFRYIHCDNSAATMDFQDDLSNLCRIGIAMYGIPQGELQHAVSFHTAIAMVKKVRRGETISYGTTYTAQQDEWIATLPVGYADGLLRANQGRHLLVNGELCEIVGRVCMDQCMIRLPQEYPVGTPVEIFGEHISVEDMAEDLHTIPYEIFTGISDRVTRIYLDNGTKKEYHFRFDGK
ncbi:MAG: alanine racemase [Solobacterium sp.]|nr:alanine racemase [Solobacterium sp.]